MKTKLFLFVTLVCVIHNVVAQTIKVKDASTGAFLEMVTISSDDGSSFVTTNKKGQAEIAELLKLKPAFISVRMLGYKTLEITPAKLKADGYSVKLQTENFQLDQVVVSATKWQRARNETPQRIATISAKDIEFQSPQTAADLLGGSGEVFIQKSQQGGGSPIIRGFSTNRILITVDGVRMNTAIFRGGNVHNVISLDAFATERAEVLFGPGSTMYGSDAIGGVLNFYTLQPDFSDDEKVYTSGSAVARYSSANNEMTGHFNVNVGWKKWAMLTSISHNNYGDLRMGRFGPEDYLRKSYIERIDGQDVEVVNRNPLVQKFTGYSQFNIMQKVRYKPNDDWDFTYGFHYSETSDVDRYDRLLRTRNGALRDAQWFYGPQVWMMNHFKAEYSRSNIAFDNMSINVAHQYFEESRHNRSVGSARLQRRFEFVNAYSANFDFFKKIGERFTINYGAEAVFNNVFSVGTDENIRTGRIEPGAPRYPMSDWTSIGAFVSGQYKVSEKVTALASLRYSHFMINAAFDSTFYPFPFTEAKIRNGAPNGSIGLTYNPDNKTSFSTNLSTGFRAPNIDDIGKVFDSEPGAVTVPNPGLGAEYVYSADIGFARVLGNAVKVDVNAYYSYLQNAMVRRDFTLNGLDSIIYEDELSQVQAIQNAANARVYGVQAGIEVKLPKGFSFSSVINYQRGDEELEDGTVSPSRHAAPAFGQTRFAYTYDKLRLELYSFYSAGVSAERMPFEEIGKPEIYAKDADGNNFTPAWYTLNIRALYRVNDMFSVNAGIENLTNRRYRPYSSGITAPGINFVLSARVNF
jgi:hemoglobin/transferrin/lactoferrin receptor protein